LQQNVTAGSCGTSQLAIDSNNRIIDTVNFSGLKRR